MSLESIDPRVANMSIKDMERAIYDILTYNGMGDVEAIKIVKDMPTKNMQDYLSTIYEIDEDDEHPVGQSG